MNTKYEMNDLSFCEKREILKQRSLDRQKNLCKVYTIFLETPNQSNLDTMISSAKRYQVAEEIWHKHEVCKNDKLG